MWRYLVQLFVAVPLFFLAYRQTEVLLGLDWARPEILSNAKLDSCESDINETRALTKGRGEPAPGVLACLLTADEHWPDARAGGSGFDATLAPSAQNYAKSLADVRKLFKCLADPNGGEADTFTAGHPFRRILDDRRIVRDLERAIGDLLDKPRAEETTRQLKNKLKEYENAPECNPLRLQEFSARIEWLEIDGLDRLVPEVDKVLPAGPESKRAALLGRFDSVIEKLKQFEAKHAAVVKERDRARMALHDLEQIRELLRIAVRDSAINEAEKAREHFADYARLVSGEEVKTDFRLKVRRTTVQFCETYLPPALKLDDKVIIQQGNGGIEVDRDSVRIKWKNKAQQERLVDTIYDEYTLPDDKVDRYWVGSTSYDGPLKGTAQSNAARKYNKYRKDLKWTEASLRVLLKETESHSAELRDVRQRTDVILKAWKDHPELLRPGE